MGKPRITLLQAVDKIKAMQKKSDISDTAACLAITNQYDVTFELSGHRKGVYTKHAFRKRYIQNKLGHKVGNTTPEMMNAKMQVGRSKGGEVLKDHKPDVNELIKAHLNKNIDKTTQTIEEVSDHFSVTPKQVRQVVLTMAMEGRNIYINERGYIIHTKNIRPKEFMVMDGKKFPKMPKTQDGWHLFGAIGDNHLGSKYARLDVLNSVYDSFVEAGVTVVFNTGNWIDGEARFNKHDLLEHGMDRQIEYFLDHYPRKAGITTYLIAGDDHEGWYTQREGIDIGQYMQSRAEARGRDDLKFIGYMEQFVKVPQPNGETTIHVLHPGGGSAYAISYTVQKIVEAYSEGEKPNILLAGHYHKADYTVARGVHCIQTACTQDQTPFMRKLKLKAVLGGWVVKFQAHPDGAVKRMNLEFLNYFNQDYYQKWHYRP